MAYLKAGNILIRVREVIEDSLGTLRTVPAGRYLGDLPPGLAPDEETRRALEKPRVNVLITGIARSVASPPINSSLILYEVTLEVRIIRSLTTLEQLSEDDADIVQALAAEDCDVIRQALEYPGNLTTTLAGGATDLASGLLRFQTCRARVGKSINDGAQPLETIHTYTGVAISRPLTS